MTVDFNELERKLAENKVYNAWQYVQSLCETLGYMEVSYEMLGKVYEHRKDTIQLVNKEIFNEAVEHGRSSFCESDLKRTDLNIGGYELDDCVFLRKTAMEFFHYGRMSMDVLFQIVNAALLGDDELEVEDKGLLGKLLRKLNSKSEFATLLQLMDNNKNDDRFQYLMAFDNYMKHIKTILITVKNSILLGNTNTFEINSFSYGGVSYPTENALSKIEEIRNYVNDTVDEMLKEILYQLPNCISNGQRIQEIHYKQVYSEYEGKPCVEYISFFIDVPNDISDLPSEIKVYPLIIKPNNEIYSFDFRFDKIFIRKQGSDENAIVGVATLKNGLDTNEFYRVYEVTACRQIDYALYVATFKETYKEQKLHMNIYAMDGTMLFIRDEEQKSE
nr:MAG TPA: hypothetical protein [Caudoviricetes sp.]